MKGLKTLLKLHKSKIDAMILNINSLNNTKLTLEEQLKILKHAISNEIKFIEIAEYTFFLDKYLQVAKQQEKFLTAELAEVNHQLSQEYNNLASEFSESKKVELLIKNKLACLETIREKKAEIILNDNILMKYNYDQES